MLREKYLKKLRRETDERGAITRVANRIGIPVSTLWRVIKGVYKGSTTTWDAIYKYYGK